MTGHRCDECGKTAHVEVLVPWVHVDTKEEGASWDPYCRRCQPHEEWPVRAEGFGDVRERRALTGVSR